jgi:hypothetical protein
VAALRLRGWSYPLMPLTMDISTPLYVSIGLIVCAFLLIAVALRRPRARTQARPTGHLLEDILARQSPGSGGRHPTGSGPRLAALEGHLRNAILDPGARERLVDAAIRKTGGDRAAAIREVLRAFERDNR